MLTLRSTVPMLEKKEAAAKSTATASTSIPLKGRHLKRKRGSPSAPKALLCLAIGLPVLVGCMGDYSPSQRDVEAVLGGLIPRGSQVEPLYANNDVDSMIVRFREIVDGRPASGQEFASDSFVESAKLTGWQDAGRRGRFGVLQRTKPGPVYFSLETVKFVFSGDGWCYLGYLQADLEEEPAAPLEDMDVSEAKWARRVLWPKLEEYVARGLAP